MVSSNFTRRHYIAIAKVLLFSKIAIASELKDTRDKELAKLIFQTLENMLIEMFRDDNPRFSSYRFKQFCRWEF
jgi:hypothetical protein